MNVCGKRQVHAISPGIFNKVDILTEMYDENWIDYHQWAQTGLVFLVGD